MAQYSSRPIRTFRCKDSLRFAGVVCSRGPGSVAANARTVRPVPGLREVRVLTPSAYKYVI